MAERCFTMIAGAQRLSVVSNETPIPPYPSDTAANGWHPELHIDRISSSDTWTLAEDDERPWLLRIWFESWRSVPVGSMPSERRLFARRIGCKTAFLEAHAEILLRGWSVHSDGLLYHVFIVEQVNAMLAKRRKSAEKVAAWRERQKQKENSENPENVTGNNEPCNRNVPVSNRQEQEQEQERKEIPDKPARSAPKKFVPPSVPEVDVYVREKGYAFDAERFVAYYESNGWKVGKNAMKDWRAACRTWHANSSDKSPSVASAIFAGDI